MQYALAHFSKTTNWTCPTGLCTFVVIENIACAYLHQIPLKIMLLPKQIASCLHCGDRIGILHVGCKIESIESGQTTFLYISCLNKSAQPLTKPLSLSEVINA